MSPATKFFLPIRSPLNVINTLFSAYWTFVIVATSSQWISVIFFWHLTLKTFIISRTSMAVKYFMMSAIFVLTSYRHGLRIKFVLKMHYICRLLVRFYGIYNLLFSVNLLFGHPLHLVHLSTLDCQFVNTFYYAYSNNTLYLTFSL